MNNKNKILVIPDIHGRTFWKDTLSAYPIDKFGKVIFLGDYLDPYPFEGISVRDAIDNFREIIKFKSEHQDKVILLLGNHDFYYYSKVEGPSRYAWNYKDEIEIMFEDDREFFQFAYETDYTLFTHSGFLEGWKNQAKRYEIELEPTEESINNLWESRNGKYVLEMVSRERGGRFNYGSCIWADCIEHLDWNEEYKGKFQVFGHSLQLDVKKYYETGNTDDIADGTPIIERKKNFAMLDCRHSFIYYEKSKRFKQL